MYTIACRRDGMEVRCAPPHSYPSPTPTHHCKLFTDVIPALHFHLTVAASADSNYEDTEFVYQPLLNEQRDRELLDLLPDYLTEEICFPRGQAAKFYCKVVDSMSKKIVLEEEEEE
jgi:hypothetical protein